MKKEIITTLNAPAPIGPYNQAVKVGNKGNFRAYGVDEKVKNER